MSNRRSFFEDSGRKSRICHRREIGRKGTICTVSEHIMFVSYLPYYLSCVLRITPSLFEMFESTGLHRTTLWTTEILRFLCRRFLVRFTNFSRI